MEEKQQEKKAKVVLVPCDTYEEETVYRAMKCGMDGGGFEPPKQFAADLQSVPFGHSGIHPC